MNNDNNKQIRPCPFCGKMVDMVNEKHNLYDCRNFLLKKFYREKESKKRIELEKMIDNVNQKLGTNSKNLVDT
ncbi:MAG: hypothetical protein ACQES5_07480 [Thermodesulfobacteriota bacterium]